MQFSRIIRSEKFYTRLLIFAILLFYLVNLKGGHNWGGDFSMYIMNARNIVRGAPYAQTGYVYNPDLPNYGPKAYPPIFPLMLAPFIAIWGVNLKVLKLVGVICFAIELFYLDQKVLPKDWPLILKIVYLFAIGLLPGFFLAADRLCRISHFYCFAQLRWNVSVPARRPMPIRIPGCRPA
jgi:hypothetical protein